MTRAYIAEYGGLGANLDNLDTFGTGCIYDSHGNLYVIGSAITYSVDNDGFADGLMLKYNPDGQLVWHKTWWDANNMNCGATNAAVSIDNQDRIAWVANSWSRPGCWYGWMDTDGHFGLGGTAQTAAGIDQTIPSDISLNNSGFAVMSTGWSYTNPTNSSNTALMPAVISITNIITTGTPGFATTFAMYDLDGSLAGSNLNSATNKFNAVVTDDLGRSYAIGHFCQDGIGRSFLAGFDTDGTVMWQYCLDDNAVVGDGVYGESLALSGGYLYTVINDNGNNGNTYVSKFEISPSGISNVWRTTYPPISSTKFNGYDIDFDSVGHVIISGLSCYGPTQGNATGYLTLSKLHHDTGALLFHHMFILGNEATFPSGPGESMVDGSADPFWGHRTSSVYQDRIAISCMSTEDLTDTSTTYYPRIVLAQVPTNGSLVTTVMGPPPGPGYYNYSFSYDGTIGSISTDTYTPQSTSFEVVDISGDVLDNFDTVTSENNATTILDYSSTSTTIGIFSTSGIRLKPGMRLRSGVRVVANRSGMSIDEGLLTEDDYILVTEDNVFALEQEIANTPAVLFGEYVLLTDDDLVITDNNDEAIVQDI
jgi:hypothetical protein